jgi:hypothetical protein
MIFIKDLRKCVNSTKKQKSGRFCKLPFRSLFKKFYFLDNFSIFRRHRRGFHRRDYRRRRLY